MYMEEINSKHYLLVVFFTLLMFVAKEGITQEGRDARIASMAVPVEVNKSAYADASPVNVLQEAQELQIESTVLWTARTLMSEASVYPDAFEAVAWVIRNRTLASEWGEYAYAVVHEPWQFTAMHYRDRRYRSLNWDNNSPVFQEALRVSLEVFSAPLNEDPTDGAVFFYSPRSMDPAGSAPGWNFSILEEVELGLDKDYFRFYRRK